MLATSGFHFSSLPLLHLPLMRVHRLIIFFPSPVVSASLFGILHNDAVVKSAGWKRKNKDSKAVFAIL